MDDLKTSAKLRRMADSNPTIQDEEATLLYKAADELDVLAVQLAAATTASE